MVATLINTQKHMWLPIRCLKSQIQLLLKCCGYPEWDIGVHFVDNQRSHELNRTYRGRDKPTDILSFPFHQQQGQKYTVHTLQDKQIVSQDYMNLGELFLSIPYIQQDCQTHHDKIFTRLPVLFTHGICHLLGYDHEADEDYLIMAKKEQEILKKYKDML